MSRTTPIGNATLISTAGGDQIVERRLMIPTVDSRKWPGVAIINAALEDRPNCHTARDAAHGREEEREVDGDALALGGGAEVNRDEGSQRETEPPVGVRERGAEADRQRHELWEGAREVRQRG